MQHLGNFLYFSLLERVNERTFVEFLKFFLKKPGPEFICHIIIESPCEFDFSDSGGASYKKWKYWPALSPDLQRNRDVAKAALVTFLFSSYSSFSGRMMKEKLIKMKIPMGPKVRCEPGLNCRCQ